jgi:hypothetical protein
MTQRIKKDAVKKGKQITESRELKVFGTPNSKNKAKEKTLMLKMKVIEIDRIVCFFSNNTIHTYKFIPTDYKYNIQIETRSLGNGNEQEYKTNLKDPNFYADNVDYPCIIYNNGKV